MRWWMWGLLSLLMCGSAVAQSLGDAQWIRDPRFSGLPVRDFFARAVNAARESDGSWNMHTLFRKEIVLREAPSEARLIITGDDYYKFYINANFVVQGPEAGYPFAYPYYRLDITDHLKSGRNVLAAHCYYQGLINGVWNSGDNRSGFFLALMVTYADGTKEEFVSDASWQCLPLEAITGMQTTSNGAQFVENVDMRLLPRGWREAGFDAAAWSSPFVERQDHVLVEQLTPPLQVYRKEAVQVQPQADGSVVYDFGAHLVGCARVRVQGTDGQALSLRHGEVLRPDGSVENTLSADCIYEDTAILSGDPETVELFDYKGFRYLQVAGLKKAPEVWVDVQHHPYPAGKSRFSSPDARLSAIWALCENGVKMGSQGIFLQDTALGKRQSLGDVAVVARSHLWLTGDRSLTRKALNDFQYSRRIHSGLMAVAPGNSMAEIAEYSLLYPILLRDYYRHTGDRAFTELMVTAVFPGLFSHFRRCENEIGLLENYQEKPVQVDFPASLQDDFDLPHADKGVNAVLNAFYYGALRAAADLLQDLDRESLFYSKHADRVAQAFGAQLADGRTGLYRDVADSSHSSLHANAIPLAFGLTTGAQPEKILELIRTKRLACSPLIASYVVEACFRAGDAQLGYDLMTGDEVNSWPQMARGGATACTETWSSAQLAGMGWCYPGSSSPIYLIAEHVFGLSPAAPGWKKVRFAPPLLANLPEMSLTVPCPSGKLTVAFVPGTGYRLLAPPGLDVVTAAANGVQAVVEYSTSQELAMLSKDELNFLRVHGWSAHVGEGMGVWVDVRRQMMFVLEGSQVLWQARTGTAEAGTGAEAGSMKTPLGWHVVEEKIGENAAWGQVFRSRTPTREIWKPGQDTREDMVLTRILWLEGLEPGKNKGANAQGHSVDSKSRCIYIHGTNGEARIGTPSSHGCIRLLNDDVITAFDMIPVGTPVLITDGTAGD